MMAYKQLSKSSFFLPILIIMLKIITVNAQGRLTAFNVLKRQRPDYVFYKKRTGLKWKTKFAKNGTDMTFFLATELQAQEALPCYLIQDLITTYTTR